MTKLVEKDNYVVVEFKDDRSIDGVAIDCHNVSAEQLAVVVFHLNRVAFMLSADQEARQRNTGLVAAQSVPKLQV